MFFFLSLQLNSRKTTLLFNVESGKFFLALSSWVSFAGVVVPAIGGSLCCYTSANQQSRDQKSWEE
jgi:hypothetical protein